MARAAKLIAWYQPVSRSRSSTCGSSSSADSRRHRTSETSDVAWSASTTSMSRRSRSLDQQPSLGSPQVSDVTWSATRPARSAKRATWTPHSYSQPQRAQVRRMTISRSRRDRVSCRPSSYEPHGEHRLGHRQVLGEEPEQGDRRFAGRHHPSELVGHLRCERVFQGCDPSHVPPPLRLFLKQQHGQTVAVTFRNQKRQPAGRIE